MEDLFKDTRNFFFREMSAKWSKRVFSERFLREKQKGRARDMDRKLEEDELCLQNLLERGDGNKSIFLKLSSFNDTNFFFRETSAKQACIQREIFEGKIGERYGQKVGGRGALSPKFTRRKRDGNKSMEDLFFTLV